VDLKTIRNVCLAAVLATGLAAAKNGVPPVTTDQAIAERAIHQVRTYPYYGVFDAVEVQAADGTLHITGEVTEPWKKSDLGRIMARIPGVNTVDNELKVAPLSPFDQSIRRQVARAIFRDPSLSKYESQPIPAIHIIVDSGHVTLEGVVNNEQDKQIAGIRANQSMGFGQPVNNLRVAVPSAHK
jgi:osmotically-inducible protein OsmY